MPWISENNSKRLFWFIKFDTLTCSQVVVLLALASAIPDIPMSLAQERASEGTYRTISQDKLTTLGNHLGRRASPVSEGEKEVQNETGRTSSILHKYMFRYQWDDTPLSLGWQEIGWGKGSSGHKD